MTNPRVSGILLPVFSLPGRYGIGDLGPAAFAFADWLADSSQRLWQILPLNPTAIGFGNSPYVSPSAFAGNPLFISPEQMVADGFLPAGALAETPEFPSGRVDYPRVTAWRDRLLRDAFARWARKKKRPADYDEFHAEHDVWVDDYALFLALHEAHHGAPWNEWPPEYRDRQSAALAAFAKAHRAQLDFTRFVQYLFFRQWRELRAHCRARGVKIFGDLPIYPAYDSADVWAHPELFKLDAGRRMRFVAGVPPDYFSATGQLWGNPVYDWEALHRQGFAWWLDRINHQARLFDLLRLDHFRGLVACWEVPAGETTALAGQWVPVPHRDFFAALQESLPEFPLVAEDLGVITDDVRDAMREFHLPGMKVLLFAFGGELATHPYVPHNHIRDCVVYTGTHDTNTCRGWFETEATADDQARLERYLGSAVTADTVGEVLTRMALGSVADTAILPLQDLLGLGAEARINRPGNGEGNWHWRVEEEAISPELRQRLLELAETYGRA